MCITIEKGLPDCVKLVITKTQNWQSFFHMLNVIVVYTQPIFTAIVPTTLRASPNAHKAICSG